MVLFFGLLTIGLAIGCIAVIVSLYSQITIRKALKKNEDLINQLKKVGRQQNYSIYSTLVDKTLREAKNKLKWIPSSKLEQHIAREINQVEKNGYTKSYKNIVYNVKVVTAIFLPIFTLITIVSMINELPSQQTQDAQAAGISSSEQEMVSAVAFSKGNKAFNLHDWETASLELSLVHTKSVHAEEAKEMLTTAQLERRNQEYFMQGMSAFMAEQYESARKLLQKIPKDSYYYKEAQEMLRDL